MKQILILVFIFSISNLTAQVDTTGLDFKEVEVVKTFEATLEDATMVRVNPILAPAKNFKPNYTYDITIVPIDLHYPDPQIRPLAMEQDGPFIVKKGYIYAGAGIKKSTQIMAGYHTARKDAFDVGFYGQFRSHKNNNNYYNQAYRDADFSIYGNYLLKENLKIYGDVSAQFLKRYPYHIDADTLKDDHKWEAKRWLNSYKIHLGIANPEPTKWKINYQLGAKLHNMTIDDNKESKARDNGFGIYGKVEKYFGKGTVIYALGDFNYDGFSGDKDVRLSTATLTPHIKTHIGNFLFDGGVDYLYSSDGRSAFFPEVELGYVLAGQKLQIFAGVDQQYFSNTFANIASRNTFLSTAIDSLVTTSWREYSGGLRGQFSFLNYQVKAGYKDITDQMFTFQSLDQYQFFDMIYDSGSAIFISGNVDFKFSDIFTFGGWLTQHIYKLNTLEKAWNTPLLEANAYAAVKLIDDKLNIRTDLFFNSGISFINYKGEQSKSGVLHDLNLEADFHLTDYLRVYVKGINLLDNQYQYLYGYHTPGIDLMAGIKWIF